MKQPKASTIAKSHIAHGVVQQIIRHLGETGWDVGRHIGNEAEICAMLGVGRVTFREAVHILERQGVIRVVPGLGGGLVIDSTAPQALAGILRNYLELSDIGLEELLRANTILEHLAANLALKRLTPARLNDLRQTLRMPLLGKTTRDKEAQQVSKFQVSVVGLSGNPALEALCSSLIRLIADFGHQERYPPRLWSQTLTEFHELDVRRLEALSKQSQSIHDIIDESEQRLLALYTKLEGINRKIWCRESFLKGDHRSALIDRGKSQKAALRLSYEIAAAIRRENIGAGESIGSIGAIAGRHGSSKIAAVEALRMLEFLGIVCLHRGRSAIVEVIEPDPANVLKTCIQYLEYIGPIPDDIAAIIKTIEYGIVEECRDGLSDSATRRLAGIAVEFSTCEESERPDLAVRIYEDLLSFGNNRVLTLIGKMLAEVHRRRGPADHGADAPEEASAARVAAAGRALIDALDQPDGNGVAEGIANLMSAAHDYTLHHRPCSD